MLCAKIFRSSLAGTVFLLLANCNTTAQAATTETVRFNGERAMADLVAQVNGGPRLPNSPGIITTRKLITDTLTEAGWEVHTQDFEAYSPMLDSTQPGQNIFAIYPKETSATYVISAHYDTRPYADMDPDPSKRMDPVPGANDGGSGVAALLELGRIIPQSQTTQSIVLVFFDLEDHGTSGKPSGFCLGSKHFASNLPPQVKDFQYGINLDMIADADLSLPMEGYSLAKASKLTFNLWKVGNTYYPETWKMQRGPMIYDDHMPFIAIGKQYIDVIDIDYPAWHTTNDTPEQCSAKSIEIVGDTVFRFITH